MKLRFEVDQAECFRRGIDCPKSIVTVDVDPSTVEPELREKIAQRLDGIDVCQGSMGSDGKIHRMQREGAGMDWKPRLIIAAGPTWDDLVEAVNENHRKCCETTKAEKPLKEATLKPRHQMPN